MTEDVVLETVAAPEVVIDIDEVAVIEEIEITEPVIVISGGGGGGTTTVFQAIWKWQPAAITAPMTGTGKVGVNNDLPLSATVLWIQTHDSDGLDQSRFFTFLEAESQIYIQQFDDATNWMRYKVTAPAVQVNAENWSIPVEAFVGAGTEPGNNKSVIVAFAIGGGGGGVTVPVTGNLLEGDLAGGIDDAGKAITELVVKQPTFPTPTNAFEIIQCLQAAGLCV